jgi:hypothetical protein
MMLEYEHISLGVSTWNLTIRSFDAEYRRATSVMMGKQWGIGSIFPFSNL